MRQSWGRATTYLQYKAEEPQRKAEEEKRKTEEEKRRAEKRSAEEEKRRAEEEKKHEQKRIETLLDQLSEMGFGDRDKNTAQLRQCGYDMAAVIEQLTAGQGARSSDPSEVGGRGGSNSAAGGASGPAFSPAWVVESTALRWKRQLGAGSFGTVFEVDYRGVLVAAKKMSFTIADERQRVEKMLCREFRALQQLQHPHILRMHGVVLDQEMSVSLLMELAELGSLRRLLTDSPNRALASEPAQVSILS